MRHAPAHPHQPLAVVERRFKEVTVFDQPALDGRRVDWHAALCPQCFDIAIAQRVRHVPPDAHKNDILRKMGTLEADHLYSPSLIQSR
jgi:hypothetical protein